MASSRLPAAPSLLAIAALLTGCFLDAGPLDGAGAGSGAGSDTGSPGTGATGAAATTFGGAGGTGAATPAGGAGGGVGGTGGGGATTTDTTPGPCSADGECPPSTSTCLAPKCDKPTSTCTFKNANDGAACDDPATPADECHEAKCKMGVCTLVQLADNTVVDDTKNGDCRKYVCDATGTVVAKPDDGDKPVAAGCITAACKDGDPVPAGDGTTCNLDIGQGQCCDGTCCDGVLHECSTAGCCLKNKTCGTSCCDVGEACCSGQCCNLGETCCGGVECCAICVAGLCVI